MTTRGLGIGASLASLGASRGREALQEAGEVAGMEQRRNIANQQLEQNEKAGNRQLGATIGSAVGMAWGPVGSLVGGAIGSIAGGLF
jgi:phage tail tape-measure protein